MKTTLFGMMGLLPDYVMILVGANMGLSAMTKEHIGIALSLKIPIYVVITKVDIAPNEVYKNNLERIKKLLRMPICGKVPVEVKSDTDIKELASSIDQNVITPIFSVSNVTGDGLDQLKKFLALVPSRVESSGMF